MSLPDNVTQAFCEVLNELVKEDSKATNELFAASFACKEELVDHPTILVREEQNEEGATYSLSTLGIVNSFLNKIGQRRIAAVLEGDDHVLLFKPYRVD